MSARILDIRLAQFKRVTEKIREAHDLQQRDRVEFLLSEADVLFTALKQSVRGSRPAPGPENAHLPLWLKIQAE